MEKFAKMTKYYNGRTKGGYWSTVKKDLIVNDIDKEQYHNIVNNLWHGDKVSRSYTSKGYLITRLTNNAPSGDVRVVYEFDID